jgi:hypothetical protein
MKLIWQLLVVGILATGVISCRKTREDVSPTVVHGQVFLVLKSGNAVKLALASVNVLPETEALAAADAAQKQAEQLQSGVAQTDISQEISSLAGQLAAKRDALRKRQQALTLEVEAMKGKRDFSEAYSAKVAEINSINSELTRNDGIKEKTEALRKAQEGAPRNFSNEFAEALLAVVKPASVTRTNADGEFTLQVPRKQGRVALLIEASRELDHVEHFVWFVWLDQLTPDGGVYLFSNHNVLGSANDANVVNVPTAPPET